MDFIMSNWFLVLAGVAILYCIGYNIYVWYKLPTPQQIANLKKWLEYAVVQAEAELGKGTGQLKLRMVYNLAIDKFDWVGKLVSFEVFSDWVDDALVWLETQLSSNENVKSLVNKEDK